MKVGASLVKLIIFAVVTALLTLILGITIANKTFGERYNYQARFSDATGVVKGDDVRVAGVRVGGVNGVKLVDGKTALVSFSLSKSIPVTSTTQATLRYRNLVGQRYLQISEGSGGGTPVKPGGTLALEQTHPALDLTALFNGFKPLFVALSPQQVNKVSFEVIQVLQGEGGTVDSLLQSVASLTNTLADRDAVIGRVVDNLTTVLATVDRRDAGLSQLIIQLQRLTSGLAEDRQPILDSLNSITAVANDTAGLLDSIRPALKEDIKQLGTLTNTLNTTKTVDGRNILDEYLTRVPDKLTAINRTASYGSFFNFYLCQFDDTSGLISGRIDEPSCNGATEEDFR